MPFNDFVITIDGDKTTGFKVRAEQRLIGGNVIEVGGEPLQFNGKELLDQFQNLRYRINTAVHEGSSNRDLILKFGCALFEELFKGAIKNGFTAALNVAAGAVPRLGLRIRVQAPPELQTLPWEFMYRTDVRPGHFLCTNAGLTLVRSDSRINNAAPAPINWPLNILVVVATPRDREWLDARKEIDNLLFALESLIQAGKVRVDFVHGADTLGRVARVAGAGNYHILHFIGHGEEAEDHPETPVLVFENSGRKAQGMTPENLFLLLPGLNPPRLVFLNVCQGAKASSGLPITSIAESFLLSNIPAVIGHQFLISDEAAKMLARHLYEGLAGGDPVDDALAHARLRTFFELGNSIESLTPALSLQNANGDLFSLRFGATPVAPQGAQLIEQAKSAAAMSRWEEAADYAHQALIIQPDNSEVKILRDTALGEEKLAAYLHEADFAKQVGYMERVSFTERVEYLETATKQYEEYEIYHTSLGRPQIELSHVTQSKQEVQARITQLRLAERQRVEQLNKLEQLRQQVAQAGAGVHDPWLQWKG